MYILLSEPLEHSTVRSAVEDRKNVNFSEWIALNENEVEIRPRENPFLPPSQEVQKLKRWAGSGAVAGLTTGLITGIIKARSSNDGMIFHITRPFVVAGYGFLGMIIGGGIGIVAYLVLETPRNEEDE